MARKTKEEALATRERLLDAARGAVPRARRHAHVARRSGDRRGHDPRRGVLAFQGQGRPVPRDVRPRDAAARRPFRRRPVQTRVGGSAGNAAQPVDRRARSSLANDPRAQNVFEIIFHKSELVDELAGLADRRTSRSGARASRRSRTSCGTRRARASCRRSRSRRSQRRHCTPSWWASCTSGCSTRRRTILPRAAPGLSTCSWPDWSRSRRASRRKAAARQPSASRRGARASRSIMFSSRKDTP